MSSRAAAFLLAVAIPVILAACRSSAAPITEARADEPATPGKAGAAVVELFTSEGCSSCPPADEVLADLARGEDRPIYALAFHVDYWDSLGWPDRFASPENTSRQRDYARAFGGRGMYTPQLVVGGTEQFTGSDRARAEDAVRRALEQPGSVELSLHPRDLRPGSVTVDYQLRGGPPGTILNLALLQRHAVTTVRAGENAGKILHHANVVRAFVSTPVQSPGGSAAVGFPATIQPDGAELVGYVQRSSTAGGGMPILGAARAALTVR